jgi:putative ABC transport system ATP-binding protein
MTTVPSMKTARHDTSQPPSAPPRVVVFETRKLTKIYGRDLVPVTALDNVDLKLYAGEMAVLLGPSGSGKSTLLNILGGLDRPTSGDVWFRGRNLTTLGEHEMTLFRREQVGFVFQFYNLVPSLTARENVALVTEIASDPMTPEEALDIVGLGNRMDHFPSELSGGEQQRVAIARAIAKRPQVMFCDEPTGALDSKTGILVLDALVAVNEEFGTTTALITHNAAIRAIAHRVIHFRDGRIDRVEENAERARPADISW